MSKYRLEVKRVESDDYGDKMWKFYVELFENNKIIWSDYWQDKPTLEQVLMSVEKA